MKLLDMHCHLTHDYYNDKMDDVIAAAKDVGVVKVVVSGVNPPTNREVLKLQEKYPGIIGATLGLYPTDLIGIKPEDPGESGLSVTRGEFDLDSELKFILENKDKILGIGEIGMDFHWSKEASEHDLQEENFRKIIRFAISIKKPIIIHSRKAEVRVLDVLEEEIKNNEIQVIHHCFSGKKKLVTRAAQLGHNLTVPAIVKKLNQFEYLIDLVPIGQLLSETDAPWLSPIPGEKNEPKNVVYSIAAIAKIKGISEKEAAGKVWEDVERIFDL